MYVVIIPILFPRAEPRLYFVRTSFHRVLTPNPIRASPRRSVRDRLRSADHSAPHTQQCAFPRPLRIFALTLMGIHGHDPPLLFHPTSISNARPHATQPQALAARPGPRSRFAANARRAPSIERAPGTRKGCAQEWPQMSDGPRTRVNPRI
ncbi:hypothetical protein PHLGIDRAFT_211370 [Phlebiopsis gigantea 11061_1 CR5-6]|uniref:Uncharacterized protein n=1 Tax=Phlebiopsis gigantea (strain 11061_1 CR5-6) TaxID=745531 RepID=A0A0C3PEZ3_PHLG1|nr:hypothetical protein PHLGIDRAFT_211370 [Phlebiopsis gigantea 11061_1 CR5-6]